MRRATTSAVVALAFFGFVGYAVLAWLGVDTTTLLVYTVSTATAVCVAAVGEVAALADALSTRAEFERQLHSIAAIGVGLLVEDALSGDLLEDLRIAYHSENVLYFQDARQTRNAVSTIASLGDYAYHASDRWLTQEQREPLALFVENLRLTVAQTEVYTLNINASDESRAKLHDLAVKGLEQFTFRMKMAMGFFLIALDPKRGLNGTPPVSSEAAARHVADAFRDGGTVLAFRSRTTDEPEKWN